MRLWVSILFLAMVACSGTAAEPAASGPAAEPAPSVSTPSPATAGDEPATVTAGAATGGGPQYDVFLAAAADVLEGTRFENAPFEDPELFAATGLLVCEALAEGTPADDFVFAYLTELTGGDAGSADDDQLALVGAVVGAATEALCTP